MTSETFYPINSPLINYFYYKAPFIANNYVLTGGDIDNQGNNYHLHDVIVLGQGVYTSPAVLEVTAVASTPGPVTQFKISNGGNYSNTPSAGLDQLATSGVGSGFTLASPTFAPSNQIPPGPNIPLAGGFLYFYADEDHTLQLPTYSDVSDPNNPVVNTNPIQLGASGECPLFYLQNRFYYIVITDYTGDQANPVDTIQHYNPAQTDESNTSAFNDNIITNPQFNWPITFWQTDQEEGEITQERTRVAFGWDFLQDPKTDSKNNVTFTNVVGQGIEGTPIFQLLLTCQAASINENNKNITQIFGEVDYRSEEDLTFSAQMINQLGITIPVNLILELNYGDNGSATQFITLTSFNVGGTREKKIFQFKMPSIVGLTIGDNNYAAIHVQPALGQTCEFGITNFLINPGIIADPVFIDEPDAFSKSQIVGDSIDLDNAGLDENWSSYYYEDGIIFPYADTGAILLGINNWPVKFRHVCDASLLPVNGYTNGIPNRRLYDVIGNKFGGAGTIIASSKENLVTASSIIGAREKSAWTAGNCDFTLNNTVIGLQAGISLVDNNDFTVSGTFIDKFAPIQTLPTFPFNTGSPASPIFVPNSASSSVVTYWGAHSNLINSQNFSITTTAPGSPSTNATFTLEFNSLEPSSYQTRVISYNAFGLRADVSSSFMEFSTFANNNRQPSLFLTNQQIVFSLDGKFNEVYAGGTAVPLYVVTFANRYVVPFLSKNTIKQNIKVFCDTIANPFTWTILVNSVPNAGDYFLFSDSVTDFYGWFTVNGSGTDPMIPSRTGVPIPLFTGFTTTQTAEAIAVALNTAEYALPGPADLPSLVTDSKVSYYINL